MCGLYTPAVTHCCQDAEEPQRFSSTTRFEVLRTAGALTCDVSHLRRFGVDGRRVSVSSVGVLVAVSKPIAVVRRLRICFYEQVRGPTLWLRSVHPQSAHGRLLDTPDRHAVGKPMPSGR